MTRAMMLSAMVATGLSLGCNPKDPEDSGPPAQESPGTIAAVASSNPELSTLVAALTKAGLVEAVSDEAAALTVFAPTNSAFAALLGPLGVTNGLDGLSAAQLRPILLYHVLGTEVGSTAAAAAATADQKITTLGGKVQLSLAQSTIRLDGRANVTSADIPASNGVIHVIDQVLLPSIADVATTSPGLSSLVAALTLADTAAPSPALVSALDDDASSTGFTVFAPTDDAFSALVESLKGSDNGATTGISALTSFRPEQLLPVLTYHVAATKVRAADLPASGEVTTLGGSAQVTKAASGVTIDTATVSQADLLASNGVIHLVDRVLLPSITDVVTTSSQFTALKGAVLAADGDAATTPKVSVALDGGSFTLLAPTNAAFAALPAAPTGQTLTNVLLYHAVPGPGVYGATALGLSAPLSAPSALAGKNLAISALSSPARVQVADGTATPATVTSTDLFTANGVIHVVDKVLLP